MKVNFAHLCDYAILSIDGKVSMMGVFSGISVGKLPSVHLGAFLVFEIELHYTELGQSFPGRVHVVDQDANGVLEMKSTLKVEGKATIGESPRMVQILRLPQLVFKKEGRHDINIFLGADTSPKYTIPFVVALRKPPQPPPIQGKPLLPPPAPPTP